MELLAALEFSTQETFRTDFISLVSRICRVSLQVAADQAGMHSWDPWRFLRFRWFDAINACELTDWFQAIAIMLYYDDPEWLLHNPNGLFCGQSVLQVGSMAGLRQ
jgi:hypothetical protein